jgi:hypothetical protein
MTGPNCKYVGRSLIGTIIGTIHRKENNDILAWKSLIKWGQLKSQKDGSGHSLTQTK